MRSLPARVATTAALCLVLTTPVFAHETDQYTLPLGREFIDLGDYFTAWAHNAIQRAVNKTNDKIRADQSAGRNISRYHSPDYIAGAVCREFPYAIILIEDLDKRMTSIPMKDRWPGMLPGYKPPPSFQKYVLYPLNPFRAWNCATMKIHGVYLGTDKVGHFTDMGMHYYQTYRGYLRKGETEEQAIRRALGVGIDDPIKSESKLLGYWTAGAYSNADLAINYCGLVFYRNLTEPQMLKGEIRPPMLQREGPFWKLAPHVRRDSDFFSWFISDHMDEALNPSHYLAGMRDGIAKIAREHTSSILELRRDEYGNRRPQAYFRQLAQELKTYWGVDYGHRGPDRELVQVAEVCFPNESASADVKGRDRLGRTALHRAAEVGDAVLARKLIEQGADVNAQVRSDEIFSSDWGNTPLHVAALNGHVELVQLLLDRGANVNAANDRGATPLHLAVPHVDVVQPLLSGGARIDARDGCGRTPLHWAAMGSNGFDSLAFLLEQDADANARDHEQQTPLHLSARYARGVSAAELVRRGADVKAGDAMGVTPLHLASSHRALAVAELLVNAGAPIDATDSLGCTPLHEATRRQADSVVAMLLEGGARPSLADRYGTTPLHVASRQGDQTVARLLLAGGADTSVRAGARGTPIDVAIRAGNKHLVTILRDEDSRAGVAASKRQ